jgi:hypothetical protein
MHIQAQQGDVAAAIETLDSMHQRKMPISHVQYNGIIFGAAKSAVTLHSTYDVPALVAEMLEVGLTPNEATINSAFYGYFANRDTGRGHRGAAELYTGLKNRTSVFGTQAAVTPATYRIVLRELAKGHTMTGSVQFGMSVVEDALKAGYLPKKDITSTYVDLRNHAPLVPLIVYYSLKKFLHYQQNEYEDIPGQPHRYKRGITFVVGQFKQRHFDEQPVEDVAKYTQSVRGVRVDGQQEGRVSYVRERLEDVLFALKPRIFTAKIPNNNGAVLVPKQALLSWAASKGATVRQSPEQVAGQKLQHRVRKAEARRKRIPAAERFGDLDNPDAEEALDQASEDVMASIREYWANKGQQS